MILSLIIFFTLLGSLCSVGLAALLLLCMKERLTSVTSCMIPGTLRQPQPAKHGMLKT